MSMDDLIRKGDALLCLTGEFPADGKCDITAVVAKFSKRIRGLKPVVAENATGDTISRQAAIDAIESRRNRIKVCGYQYDYDEARKIGLDAAKEIIVKLPPAEQRTVNNKVHLCDSCEYLYPDCPCEHEDVIFGGGKGNDNICACAKYKPKPVEQRTGRWIPCKERLPGDDEPNEVYCINEHGVQMVGSVWECGDGFAASNGESYMCDVVAWMPPFEPYKESENEQT